MIPTAETAQAEQLFKAGRYPDAVAAAKAALNKNERYTPAMLVMAKSFYKLHKYEWMKKLWEMMQANGASNAEKSEIYQLLGLPRGRREERPRRHRALQAGDRGASRTTRSSGTTSAPQYLTAKNYTEATPVLEKAVQLQPGFAKAHLNLGDAYRGDKEYEKAQAEYDKALQLFPNYADAVFNLGILYLDADKIPNMDLFAKENTAIQYFQKYKQMMGGTLPPRPIRRTATSPRRRTRSRRRRSGSIASRSSRSATPPAPPRRPPTTPRRRPPASRPARHPLPARLRAAGAAPGAAPQPRRPRRAAPAAPAPPPRRPPRQ